MGFIKIERSILKWGWYKDPATKAVFLHLLLNANYDDGEFFGEEIKTGQVVFGRKKYAEELGLSEQNVRTAMKHLHKTGEISTSKVTNKFSVITIEKWEEYQSRDVEDNQQSNQQLTNDQPTTNQQLTTSKKERNKEIKNNNRRFAPPSVDDVKAYCQERNNKVNPEAFVDFYTSKNWMVGKNKMKDWRAAVRNWERMEAGRSRQDTSKSTAEPPKYKQFAPEPERKAEPMTAEQRANAQKILSGINDFIKEA